MKHTVCPRSLDTFYIINYCLIWVKTAWTYCTKIKLRGEIYCIYIFLNMISILALWLIYLITVIKKIHMKHKIAFMYHNIHKQFKVLR